MIISVFDSLTNTTKKKDYSLPVVLDLIRQGYCKNLIDEIRQGDKEKKLKLPCVTFSGTFSKRNSKNLQEKSGIICLDYDNVKNLQEKKQELMQEKYTLAVFVSPSGNGLKQLIKVSKEGNHKKQFLALQEKYNDIDPSGKDIARICFMSYDPELYYNPNALTWYQEKEIKAYQPTKKIHGVDEAQTVKNLLTWFDKNYTMEVGTRNKSLFILACSLLVFGIKDIKEILQEKNNGLDEKEINNIMRSAQETTKDSFNTKKFDPPEGKSAVIKPLNKSQEKTLDLSLITGETIRDILSSLYDLKKNAITQRIEINGEEITDFDDHIMYDKVNTFIKTKTGVKKELTKTAYYAGVSLLAQQNTYHPLQEFFAKNKWDGKPRLQEFLGCFKDSYGQSNQYLYKWLLGSIEKLNNPSFQNEVLVLEGNSGIGKTRTVSLIARPFKKYTRFGGALNPDNKDHKLELTNNFIYEWGEGSNISKRSEDSLKELLTASYITERPAYARHPVTKPVIASIIMTKNSGTFLRDDAEKRRFNILYLDSIDKKILEHAIDMEQVWLECYALWQQDYNKNWNYVDQEVKEEIFESAMDRPAVWDILDRLVIKADDNAFTLESLNNVLEQINPKWDRNKYGNRKDVRAYFKRRYNIEPKKSRACSQKDENPYFCIIGYALRLPRNISPTDI